jgi:hypothetical protein
MRSGVHDRSLQVFDSVENVYVRWAEPYNNLLGSRINRAHPLDLVVPFCGVLELKDLDRVQ